MIPLSSCPPWRQLDRSGHAGDHDGLAVVTPRAGTRSTTIRDLTGTRSLDGCFPGLIRRHETTSRTWMYMHYVYRYFHMLNTTASRGMAIGSCRSEPMSTATAWLFSRDFPSTAPVFGCAPRAPEN